jgi:hypothetical protein
VSRATVPFDSIGRASTRSFDGTSLLETELQLATRPELPVQMGFIVQAPQLLAEVVDS